MNELYEKYKNLIIKKVFFLVRENGAFEYYEDLLSEGFLILVDCYRNFDNSLGVPFGAYLVLQLRRLNYYLKVLLRGYYELQDEIEKEYKDNLSLYDYVVLSKISEEAKTLLEYILSYDWDKKPTFGRMYKIFKDVWGYTKFKKVWEECRYFVRSL